MLRTKSGLPKHCTYQADRYGNRRVRFRRREVSVYLTGIPWSEDFMRQYAAALEREQGQHAQIGAAKRTLARLVLGAVRGVLRLARFRGLKASTQAVRRNILERFRAEHGHFLFRDLQRATSVPSSAPRQIPRRPPTICSRSCAWCSTTRSSEGMIASNPALAVKRYKRRGEGIHTWSESEVPQFQAHYPIGSKARLALELLLSTGQRRSDVVRMGRQHIEGRLRCRPQEKTDEPLLIPIDAALDRRAGRVAAHQHDLPADRIRLSRSPPLVSAIGSVGSLQ